MPVKQDICGERWSSLRKDLIEAALEVLRVNSVNSFSITIPSGIFKGGSAKEREATQE